MISRIYVTTFILVFMVFGLKGQETETHFTFSGYMDVYYAYDFNEPADGQKQYVTQTARHNEFNLNMGLLKASYDDGKLRANFGLHTGTYPSTNYAAEPVLAQLIHEANFGIRLGENTWIDMGIMGGHFGYENVLSIDNEMYTHALVTEYTPYYQTGIQLTHELTHKLIFRATVINGWQNIFETNDAKSVGIDIDYWINDNLLVSYGNYFGNEGDGGEVIGRKYRFHNNLHASYTAGKLVSTIIFDITRQELINVEDEIGQVIFVTWINGYSITDHWKAGLRYEYVADEDEILFSTLAPGFQTHIITGGINYYPKPNAAIRAELKSYWGEEDIWTSGNEISSSNLMINLGMSLKVN
jgi:hypothetical protein